MKNQMNINPALIGFKAAGRAAKIFAVLLGIFIFFIPCLIKAQTPATTAAKLPIDLLLKGGTVIDPKNKINSKMDVAITAGKIFKVAANIPANTATKVVDVSGMYVAPGFIDMHTHVFVGSNPGFADGSSSISPDDFAPRAGITTVVDAGTSGWENFPVFKAQVIDRSKTRILAFLNIFNNGFGNGSAFEPEMKDVDAQKTAEVIKKYPDIIVGSRIGHYSGNNWEVFDRAVEAGRLSNTPLLVECHIRAFSLEDQLKHMRPGDIMTHAFEQVSERQPVVDPQGKVLPIVLDAQKRGILFDVGHGGGGFWFSQAIPALKQGLAPNSFGTDMHRSSVNAGMKDMLNVMSKYLNMGMSVPDIIARASWMPAQSLKRTDLGNLSEGAVADVAVIRVNNGKYGFFDAGGFRLDGTRKLENELTVRNGAVIWDLNGIAAKPLNLEERVPAARRQ
jgi:dihydroorotase